MAKASITCDECGRTFSGHGNNQVAAEEDAMFKLEQHTCPGSSQDSSSKKNGKSKGDQ